MNARYVRACVHGEALQARWLEALSDAASHVAKPDRYCAAGPLLGGSASLRVSGVVGLFGRETVISAHAISIGHVRRYDC